MILSHGLNCQELASYAPALTQRYASEVEQVPSLTKHSTILRDHGPECQSSVAPTHPQF